MGICYHSVRRASVAGMWKVGFVKVLKNVAKCLTMILSGTAKGNEVEKWMWYK